MARFAENTSVSTERSRAEIEATLRRYGATGFLYGYDADKAFIAFMMKDRHVKFFMKMPHPAEKRFTHTPARAGSRSPAEAHQAWDQACRQSWRALALVIKAKLEAVAAGITIFDDEFLAHIVMPDGKTVAEHIKPMIGRAYETGDVPKLLPDYSH